METMGVIRLRDWQVFAEVSRAKSIREAGRRLGLTSGQVSKMIQGLESRLGTRLFKRSTSGVLLTERGNEIIEVASEMLANAQKMEVILGGKKARTAPVLAIAGTSFLTTHLLVPALSLLDVEHSFRFLDLAPDQLVPAGLRAAFEVAAHFGKVSWPGTWVSEPVGRSEWNLCVRTGHPLSKRPTLAQVLEYPFVSPTYWTSEGLARGNDQFPVPMNKRKTGFETATADAAVPILLHTDQVAFLPTLLTRPWLDRGELRLITLKEIPKVEKELYLSARADAISAKTFERLVAALKTAL